VLGAVFLVALAAVLALAIRPLRSRRLAARPARGAATASQAPAGRGTRIIELLAMADLAAGASLAASGSAHEFTGVTDARYAHVVEISAQQIRQRIPDQPITITVSSPNLGYRKRRLLFGLAYVLTTWGYSPRLSQFGPELGTAYVLRPGLRITRVRITPRTGDVLIAITPARSRPEPPTSGRSPGSAGRTGGGHAEHRVDLGVGQPAVSRRNRAEHLGIQINLIERHGVVNAVVEVCPQRSTSCSQAQRIPLSSRLRSRSRPGHDPSGPFLIT
jgi:hypothetical protein